MLARQQIVDLARAYKDQEDCVKEIEWRTRKVAELEDEYLHKLCAARSDLARAKGDLVRAEGVIFNLEIVNGNFKGGT